MKEKILELRKKGYSYNEIKKELNCAKSTISYHCKNEGLGDNLSKLFNEWELTKNEINKIDKLFNDGVTKNNIYKKMKINNKKITKQKINIMYRIYKNGGFIPNKIILSDNKIEEIKECYNKIGSLRKVAKKFNLSRYIIRKHVQVKKKLTKEELKENRKRGVINWRRRTRDKLINYKGGKCEICGYNKSKKALEFHHKDPSEKDFSLGGKSWAFDRLKKEVEKCILVCANCHREIHDGVVKI